MGPSDLLKPVIERKLRGEVKFGRVSIKPGKPTTFAIIPADASNNASGDTSKMFKPLFALPGNPASALVTFNVFVVPALRKLGGWEFSGVGCQLPRVRVEVRIVLQDVLFFSYSCCIPSFNNQCYWIPERNFTASSSDLVSKKDGN